MVNWSEYTKLLYLSIVVTQDKTKVRKVRKARRRVRRILKIGNARRRRHAGV